MVAGRKIHFCEFFKEFLEPMCVSEKSLKCCKFRCGMFFAATIDIVYTSITIYYTAQLIHEQYLYSQVSIKVLPSNSPIRPEETLLLALAEYEYAKESSGWVSSLAGATSSIA